MAIQHKFVTNLKEPAEGFGASLRRWRLILELTLDELAHAAGLDRSMISRLETGSRVPSRLTLIALADALSLTGTHRALFIGALCYTEFPLTESQATMIAGWRDGFTRR